MHSYFEGFVSDEDGAVTIDWVALTAAVLVLGALIGVPIGRAAVQLAEEAGSTLAAAEVPTLDIPQ